MTHEPLTLADLDEIEQRARLSIRCPLGVSSPHHLDLYALARTDVPRLVAEARRLREQVREIVTWIDGHEFFLDHPGTVDELEALMASARALFSDPLTMDVGE